MCALDAVFKFGQVHTTEIFKMFGPHYGIWNHRHHHPNSTTSKYSGTLTFQPNFD
jgi:hypothetical protein